MAGVDAFGTQWEVSDDGVHFDDVANVTEIGILDASAETIDVTAHDSADGWREFVGGVKDGGELSMSINYDPAVHGAIFDLLGEDGVSHKITMTDSGAAIAEFDGIVTGFSVGAPFDDKLSGEVTIKVTGKPTVTP